MRPGTRRALGYSEEDIETKAVERLKSKLRAHVERPFRVIKQQFGYRKIRYKGLAKNTNRDLCKKALFAPSVVGKCSFISHKLRFAA